MNAPDPSLTSFPLKLYMRLGRHKNFNEKVTVHRKLSNGKKVMSKVKFFIYLDFKHMQIG